jgi:hypothetical protein
MADNTPIDIIRSRDYDHELVSQDLLYKEDQRQDERPTGQLEQQQNAAPDVLEDKYQRDVPPDGGYGWVCVACVFWINAHTWGINSVCLPEFIAR